MTSGSTASRKLGGRPGADGRRENPRCRGPAPEPGRRYPARARPLRTAASRQKSSKPRSCSSWADIRLAAGWVRPRTRGRKTVVIPITEDVRAVLDDLDRGECPTVLQTSDGLPWTPPGNGLDSGVRRAGLEADEAAKRSGRASAGLEGLRFHDLRGTAATNFIRAGLPLDDVATILGWEFNRVKEIARRYVTGETIGLGMTVRLQETQNRRPTVKPAVKPEPRRGRSRRSNPYRTVAGELGLEPRMTVPKTVVLPLHHSPAVRCSRRRSASRRGAVRYAKVSGDATPEKERIFIGPRVFCGGSFTRLRGPVGMAISPLLDASGGHGSSDCVKSECGSVW